MLYPWDSVLKRQAGNPDIMDGVTEGMVVGAGSPGFWPWLRGCSHASSLWKGVGSCSVVDDIEYTGYGM